MAAEARALAGSGSVELPEAVFAEPYHPWIVHEAVRAEQNARRAGTHSTKTRAEVSMTGAKAFRQKGTGRARAGALSTPQRIGGGIAFGPKPRHYTVKVNRKVRRRAMRSALSVHADRGSIGVLDAGAFDAPSTRRAVEALEDFAVGKVLVLVAREGEENCVKSFRNLQKVKVLPVEEAGVSDVIGAARLVVSQGALAHFEALAPERDRTRTRGEAVAS